MAFNEAGGWAVPGSYQEQPELHAESVERLSRVLSMGGRNPIFLSSFFLHFNF